jgi:hypothetical protein
MNPETQKPVKVRSILYNKKHKLYPQAFAIYQKLKKEMPEKTKKTDAKNNVDDKKVTDQQKDNSINTPTQTQQNDTQKNSNDIDSVLNHLHIDQKKFNSIKNTTDQNDLKSFTESFKKNINPNAKPEDINLAFTLWNTKNPDDIKNILQSFIKEPESINNQIPKGKLNRVPKKFPVADPKAKAELERRRQGIEKFQKTFKNKVSEFDIDQLNDLELEKCKDENELQERINLVYPDNTQANKEVYNSYKKILFPFNKEESKVSNNTNNTSQQEKPETEISTKQKLEGKSAAVQKIHDKLKVHLSKNEWTKLKDANLENITDKDVLKHEINQIFEPGDKNTKIFDLYKKALFPFESTKKSIGNNRNRKGSGKMSGGDTGSYVDTLANTEDSTDSDSSAFDDVAKNNVGKYMALGIMGAFAAGTAILTKKTLVGLWNSFKDFLGSTSSKK